MVDGDGVSLGLCGQISSSHFISAKQFVKDSTQDTSKITHEKCHSKGVHSKKEFLPKKASNSSKSNEDTKEVEGIHLGSQKGESEKACEGNAQFTLKVRSLNPTKKGFQAISEVTMIKTYLLQLLDSTLIRILEKHGVPSSHLHFKACFEKLYTITKCFLKVMYSCENLFSRENLDVVLTIQTVAFVHVFLVQDLTSVKCLREEMESIAEDNVQNVRQTVVFFSTFVGNTMLFLARRRMRLFLIDVSGVEESHKALMLACEVEEHSD